MLGSALHRQARGCSPQLRAPTGGTLQVTRFEPRARLVLAVLNKTIQLRLKDFAPTPHSLRQEPTIDKPVSEIAVDIGQIYHHYYLDNYGTAPPAPDPANFEYAQFFTQTQDLRFLNDGLGDNPSSKRNRSTELGQAFCRWFLSQHVGIVYFAHFAKILNKPTHKGFEGLRVSRIKPGLFTKSGRTLAPSLIIMWAE